GDEPAERFLLRPIGACGDDVQSVGGIGHERPGFAVAQLILPGNTKRRRQQQLGNLALGPGTALLETVRKSETREQTALFIFAISIRADCDNLRDATGGGERAQTALHLSECAVARAWQSEQVRPSWLPPQIAIFIVMNVRSNGKPMHLRTRRQRAEMFA